MYGFLNSDQALEIISGPIFMFNIVFLKLWEEYILKQQHQECNIGIKNSGVDGIFRNNVSGIFINHDTIENELYKVFKDLKSSVLEKLASISKEIVNGYISELVTKLYINLYDSVIKSKPYKTNARLV